MEKIHFKDLNNYYNKEIEIQGFIDNIRDLQYVQFIVLRDFSGKIQVTVEKNEENEKLNKIVSALTTESIIKVKGTLLESPKVKLNGMELIPSEIKLLSLSEQELPFNYKLKDASQRETKLD